jgi:hypothetical protein
MTCRKPVLVLLMAAAMVTVARSGHELPVYPSYYPHEIEIATVAPERAAALLADGKLHAYVGGAPRFDRAPPETIQSVESLGSFVTVRLNPASPQAREGQSACAAAHAAARAVAARNRDVVLHPYPVTPLHGDYLHHADLADGIGTSLTVPAESPAAKLEPRDIEIEEVAAADLVAAHTAAVNGWLGPPWVRSGWYQAYLLLADALPADAKAQAESELQRLQAGNFTDAAERINAERALVARLVSGCRKLVVGYTVKREYFNAEFSAGIENVGFDALEGFNAPIFIRTVKLKDFPWNGWLQLGIDARPTAAWNPVGGFTDRFGRLMWFAIADPIAIPSPYDSTWMLNRASDVQIRAGR